MTSCPLATTATTSSTTEGSSNNPTDEPQLIQKFLPLATRAARSLWRRRRWLDLDDLVGQAQLVLVGVVRELDASRLAWLTPEEYVYWKIVVGLKDYLRGHLGRNGQRVPVLLTVSLDAAPDGMPCLGEFIEDRRAAPNHEGPTREEVKQLVATLPLNCKVAIRCLLLCCRDGGDGWGAGVMLMDKIGKGESRAGQVKNQAIELLREMGEERVREILFGRGE